MSILQDELSKTAEEYFSEILNHVGKSRDISIINQRQRELRDSKSQLNKEIEFCCAISEINEYLNQERLRLFENQMFKDRQVWEAEMIEKLEEEKSKQQDIQREETPRLPFDYVQKKLELTTACNTLEKHLHEREELKEKLLSIMNSAIKEKQEIVFAGHKSRLDILSRVRDYTDEQIPKIPKETVNYIANLYDQSEKLQTLIAKPDVMDNPQKYFQELKNYGMALDQDMSDIEMRANILQHVEGQNKLMEIAIKAFKPDLLKEIDIEGEVRKLAEIDKRTAQEMSVIMDKIEENTNKIHQVQEKIEELTGDKLEINLKSTDTLMNGFLKKYITSNLESGGMQKEKGLDDPSPSNPSFKK